MFDWNQDYKWHFDDQGIQDNSGFNDGETGMFKGRPYKGLAKEILQNSLDAKDDRLPADVPVRVVFEKLELDSSDIPGADRLQKVTEQCAKRYQSGGDGEKTKKLADYARLHLVEGATIPVLKISDYNTTGAYGVHNTEGTVWSSLVRERGATYKSSTAAGSHGVGKFATYAFSTLRTILYSTRSDYTGEVETAFQGKAILTTFVDYEDNKKKQPTTVFGNSMTPECDAIFDMNDIPASFQREENGTDVIAVGFDSEDIWKEQIAISVLQYCFFAVYEGRLEVEIKDSDEEICIKRDNLREMMDRFKKFVDENPDIEDTNFTFDAPEYLEVLELMAERGEKPIVRTFENRGDVMLFLNVDSKYPDKKVYEMRKAGMQIMQDTRFSYPAYFRAIFIATGDNAKSDDPKDNIDAFLRLCEDQAHNEWSGDYWEGSKAEKTEAKRIISQIHKFVLENVREKAPRIEGDSVNAFGLSELIPNKYDKGENSQEEKAFGNFTPVAFTLNKRRKKNPSADISIPANAWGKKRKPRVEPKPEPGKRRKRKKPNNKQTKKGKAIRPIEIDAVATPYDVSAKSYVVTFTPREAVETGLLELKAGTDDRQNSVLETNEIKMGGNTLSIDAGFISLGKLNANVPVVLNVFTQEEIVYSLEVNLYAKC